MQAQERIEQYKKIHGKAPGALWLANVAKISHDEAERFLSHTTPEIPRIKNDNGKLLEVKTSNRIRSYITAQSMPSISLNTDTQKIDTAQVILPGSKLSLRQKVQSLLMAALPFIFFTAATVGAYRSFTLCYSYFARYNSADGALTMSIMLVLIAFGAPQAVHILWESAKKFKRLFLFTCVCFLSLASISTNVFITAQELVAQKNDSRTGLSASALESDKAISRIAEIDRQRAEISSSLDMDKQERSVLMEAIKSLEVGTYNYNRTRQNIADAKARMDGAIASMSTLDSEAQELRKNVTTATVQGATVSDIDNAINWAGSIIIEIGGPVVLALSLTL